MDAAAVNKLLAAMDDDERKLPDTHKTYWAQLRGQLLPLSDPARDPLGEAAKHERRRWVEPVMASINRVASDVMPAPPAAAPAPALVPDHVPHQSGAARGAAAGGAAAPGAGFAQAILAGVVLAASIAASLT